MVVCGLFLLHLCMGGALGGFNEPEIQERDNWIRCNEVRNGWWLRNNMKHYQKRPGLLQWNRAETLQAWISVTGYKRTPLWLMTFSFCLLLNTGSGTSDFVWMFNSRPRILHSVLLHSHTSHVLYRENKSFYLTVCSCFSFTPDFSFEMMPEPAIQFSFLPHKEVRSTNPNVNENNMYFPDM